MKIVCENCGAKYSIADEKVQGKVFRIRCKKCSEAIVVRGDTAASEAAAPAPEPKPAAAAFPSAIPGADEEDNAETKVFDYSGYQSTDGNEAIWHISVDGQQQGPYTKTQILEYLEAGSLTQETYMWKEGFEDWKPLKDVPGLIGPGAAAPAPAAAEPTPAPAATGGPFNAPTDEGVLAQTASTGGAEVFSANEPASPPAAESGSPYAEGGGLFAGSPEGGEKADVFTSSPNAAAAPDGGGLFTAPSSGTDDVSGGLFTAPADDVPADGGDLFSSAPAEGEGGGGLFDATASPARGGPRVTAEQMMTGQRNENSVLFSLSNLQALASTPTEQVAAAPAGDDASGLIDIRTLAGAAAATENDSSADAIMSIGGAGFAPSLGAPILAAQKEGVSPMIKGLIVGGGVLIVALIVVVLVVMLQTDEKSGLGSKEMEEIALLKKQLEILNKQGGGASSEANVLEQKIAKAQAEVKQQDKEVASVAPTAKEAGSSSHSDRRSSSGRSSKSSSSSSKSSTPSSTASSASRPKASSKPSGRKSDELDDLLGGAIGKQAASKPKASKQTSKSTSSSKSSSPAKTKLTRSQVQSGMNSVSKKVKKCGKGAGGTIIVSVVISPTGRVTRAKPTGKFAGTSTGLCAARAVQSARFPKHSGSALTVKYPFRL